MAEPANYIFLPWVRPGTAARIPDAATDLTADNQALFRCASSWLSTPTQLLRTCGFTALAR
jgi:hypothetical protein